MVYVWSKVLVLMSLSTSNRVDDDLIDVEASRALQEGRIQVVSVAEKPMSPSSAHVCETGCVTVLLSTAVPTVTVKVDGNVVGQGLDQDPSDATRNSEEVPAISDMICGKRHCMVDVGFRQKPSCSPWSAKTAALPDAGGQGTVSINADLCRAAKCERVFNDSLSWYFASSTENADEESVKAVQFKVIEGLTPNVTIDGETVKGRSLYRSMLLDGLSSIADDGKDRAGVVNTSTPVEANNDIVMVQPSGFAVTTSTVLIGRDHSVDCVMMFSLVPYFEHPRGWYSLCVLNEVAVVDEGLRREDGSLANTVHNVMVHNAKRRLRLKLDRRKLKDVFCSSRDDIPGVGADPITVYRVEGLVERVFLVSVDLIGLYESQFGRLEVLATVNVNAACADFQRLSDTKPKKECLCSSYYEWFFWRLLARVRVSRAGMSRDHILHVLCIRGMYGYITIKQPVSLCDILGIVKRIDALWQGLPATFSGEWSDQRERSCLIMCFLSVVNRFWSLVPLVLVCTGVVMLTTMRMCEIRGVLMSLFEDALTEFYKVMIVWETVRPPKLLRGESCLMETARS
ncbi:hypothetical protein FOZ63_032659 [Perkinsus olseni]|uniref:Uncharacterized protein n=1 Tax=Perkinsus olseni TaxID=32597 RepID=A0A7J6SZK2_PEROL|nr:hypothetical protein FOZ63_032659 [Perkinsus olseni]